MKLRIVVLLAMFAALPVAVLAAGSAKQGKQVFAAHCQMCHGPNGEGNPALAKMLHATIPPLGSKAVQSLSDAQIKEVIANGKGKMQAIHGLSAADITNVIAFVRTLGKK